MANTLPPDYQVQHEQLQQRQALTQSLMQQALQPDPGRMVGNVYARPGGVSEVAAPIIRALLARRMAGKNDEQAAALAEQYRKLPASDEKFGHTPVKMQGPEGKLVDVLIGDRGTVRSVSGFDPAVKQEATAGGQLYDPYSGKPGQWHGEHFGPSKNVNGEVVQFDTRSGKAHQVANRPSNVSVNASPVVMGQKSGMSEYFKNAAGQVQELGKAAGASQELLNTLRTLKELHNAGIHSNITSDAATAASNLAQQLGMKVDANTLANTETYNSLITDLWQRSVSQYGGNRGVTKDEAEEIKKLTPLARTSPKAREQLFAIQERAAVRAIQKYQQANKSFAEAAAADDPRLFQIPGNIEEAYVPAAGNTPNPAVAGGGRKRVRFEDLR